MNDQPGQGSPSPEQEDRVRRLLAAARHDEPIPVDVAERLERVLAGLGPAAPAASARRPPVVDLAARRRRRKAGQLLLAAAAVVVAGVGIGQVLGTVSGDDSSSDSAGSASVERSGRGEGGGMTADKGAPESAAEPDQDDASALAAAVPLTLSSAHLERELSAQLRRLPDGSLRQLRDSTSEPGDSQTAPQPLLAQVAGFSCPAVDLASTVGDLVPASYDGAPVVVSVATGDDGTLRGAVLDCSTGAELASVPVRLP